MLKKSVFAMAVVAAVLAIPLLSSAATSVVVVGPISASTSVACYPFSRSLSIGVSGSDVTALQNYLQVQGYFNTTPTGYFGVITRAAVGQWQAQNNVAAIGTSGNGIFGPLSRGLFGRLCLGGGDGGGTSGGGQNSGGNNGSTTTASFSANPQSGSAPLTVQFIATAPQGSTLGNAVNFGDGTQGNLGVVPVCSSCNAEGIVSHTYTSAGTYNATLTSGVCSCPANGICNCPMIQILATTTVVVGPVSSATTTTPTASNIEELNSPGTIALAPGDIAEILNESAYFTLENITSSSATVQITPVGCWNSFPSDPTPKIVCMLAMVPIPPQVFALGETYNSGSYSITLTQLASGTATFSVQ